MIPSSGAATPPPLAPQSAPSEQPMHYPGPMLPSTSGWAIASLACAIVGLCPLPILGTVLGIIFGHIALHDIEVSRGSRVGQGMAVAGLAIGYGTLALGFLLIAVILLLRSGVSSFWHLHTY